MKTKTSIVLAGAGFLSGYFFSPSAPPQGPARAVKDKETSPLSMRARPQPAAPPDSGKVTENREEEASFAQWEGRFAALIAECGTREAAAARLLSELDLRYARWVDERLSSLESASYVDRLDAIADMEESIREGAAAVLDHLGIPGSRQASVLAASMEALSAEVQYGMAAPSHEKRVALLRLDREREARMTELLATAAEDTRVQVTSELDSWYDAGLREISGSDELN